MKIPNHTSHTHRGGFTLIELLVVISIIAILAGFAMPVFTSAQKKGRITDSVSNCHQITLALRMYAGDNDGVYPATTVSSGATTGTPLAAGDFSNKAFENLMPKYTTSKKIFANKASAWCKNAPNDVGISDANTIKQGQNDWLYLLGLSDTSDSRWPLVATGTKSSSDLTYTTAATDKGGVWGGTDAVVGYCDGSVKPASSKEMDTTTPTATFVKNTVLGSGNILTGTSDWMGAAVIALAPE